MYYVFINRFSSFERIQNELLVAMDRISLLPHDLGINPIPVACCNCWSFGSRYATTLHALLLVALTLARNPQARTFYEEFRRTSRYHKQLAIRENCYSVQLISLFKVQNAECLNHRRGLIVTAGLVRQLFWDIQQTFVCC